MRRFGLAYIFRFFLTSLSCFYVALLPIQSSLGLEILNGFKIVQEDVNNRGVARTAGHQLRSLRL